MHLNRIIAALVVALAAGPAVLAADESLASIFTNTSKSQSTVAPRRASIVYIACHGLALGDLSCYGQTNFQTPNIDRLAAEGMRFTDYRVTSDNLSEVQAALMSGHTTPFSSGDANTLAAELQRLGYRAGLMGEWALGPEPWKQGFTDFGGFRRWLTT